MTEYKLADITQDGKKYIVFVLVEDVIRGTAKNGSPYCTYQISDGQTKKTAVEFECDIETRETLKHSVAKMELVKNGAFLNVSRLRPAPEKDIKDYILTAPMESEKMYDDIVGMLGALECDYKSIALRIYEKNKDDILMWAAGQFYHHNYYGGFLYHTLRMMKAAEALCNVYPLLDKNLLLIGTSLHDIGKLREFKTSDIGEVDYMPEGVLLSHLSMGIEMIDEAIRESEEEYNQEDVLLLKHMIASHHGKREYGAIVTPAIPEAYILNMLDMMDSRVTAMEDIMSTMEPGTVTERASQFFDGGRLYKRVGHPQEESEDEELPDAPEF